MSDRSVKWGAPFPVHHRRRALSTAPQHPARPFEAMATSFPPYSAPSAAGANAPTPASGTGPQPPAGPRNGVNSHSNRIDVVSTVGGRILCIADVRGESLASSGRPWG